MSLFSKPKVVLWPKDDSLEIYLDQSDNNTFSFEIDLWSGQSEDNLRNLATFLKQNKVTEAYVLLNDTYVITKTFIYDSVVTKLDPGEVITLAKDSIDFKISPESVTFDLESENNRTLVRTRIFNQDKFQILTANIQKLGIKVLDFETISSSVIKLYSHFDKGQYFFFYSLNTHDYVAILANKGNVYLTSIIKKTLPELKKLLNYASAYFNNKEPVQYLPGTNYNEAEICQRFQKASNFPLPVLAFYIGNTKPASAPSTAIINPVPNPTPVTTPVSAIIETPAVTPAPTPAPTIIGSTPSSSLPPMENNKKSLLPIIAVFIVTAIVASVIVWLILNQNKGSEITPGGETPAENVSPSPVTQAPVPTVAEISKTLKIQVLNATEINGQAATIKAALTKLGFTSVTTGNGKEAATSNQIQLKKGIAPDYFLQNVTGFTTATTSELPTTSTYDVVFIIGVDLKTGAAAPVATATATTAPKATPTTKVSTPSASPTVSR